MKRLQLGLRQVGAGLLVALAMTLAGCAGNTGSPSLFLLDNSYPAGNDAPTGAPTLVIAPVTLAPYLDGNGIVYQTEPHRVVLANNNRWASPLAAQLTDGLYTALGGRLDDVAVMRAGLSAPRSALRVTIRVDEFLGHYDGYAHIAGRWQLLGPDGARLAGRRFERRIPLRDDGYAALVDSLSKGWRMTAETMARALAKDIAAR